MGSMNRVLSWLWRRREENPLIVWREVLWVVAFILIIWGMYRFLLSYPVWLEETLFKGLVFGGPVFWLVWRRLGWKLKDLGMSPVGLLPAVHLGILLGLVMGLMGQMGNLLRHGQLIWSSYGLTSETIGGFLILSLVTAFWEQLVFSGYMLKRLYKVVHDEVTLVSVVALLFALVHVPALLIIQQLGLVSLAVSFLLLFLLQCGCGILRLRVGNLAAPIMAHALWGVTIYLFR
jgi:hypothetical protein